jgi:hypothetical protein
LPRRKSRNVLQARGSRQRRRADDDQWEAAAVSDDNWLNDCLTPSVPYSVRRRRNARRAALLIMLAIIALACGYFGAPYIGMAAVTLSDGINR